MTEGSAAARSNGKRQHLGAVGQPPPQVSQLGMVGERDREPAGIRQRGRQVLDINLGAAHRARGHDEEDVHMLLTWANCSASSPVRLRRVKCWMMSQSGA